ncbi:hypothetical protein ACJW31_01G019600 [Castanea mollissima]
MRLMLETGKWEERNWMEIDFFFFFFWMRKVNFIEVQRNKNKGTALRAVRLNDVLDPFPHLVCSISFCKLSKGMRCFVVRPFQVTNIPSTKRLKESNNSLVQMAGAAWRWIKMPPRS